jgi:hypothetical protein
MVAVPLLGLVAGQIAGRIKLRPGGRRRPPA